MRNQASVTGRQVRRSGLVLFAGAAALATACLDPTGDPSILAELRVRPVYPAGMEPAALRIQLDSVWAVVRRSSPDQVVVDRVRPSPGDEGELRWVIDIADPEETVRVSLELRSGLDPMYAGAADAAVREGPLGQAELHDIPVDYVGPTPRAASVEVIPSRVAMRAVGERRTVRAVVLDQAGDTVFRPVTWTAADPGVASVDAAGEVTAAASGSTHVIAAIDGLADSAVVIVDTALARSSTITADSTSMMADGVSASLVTVRVLDGSGSPVGASAGTVTLSATLGTIAPVPATDHGDGTYTATLTAGTTTGLAVVNGTLSGAAITDTAGVELRAGPLDATTTTITADSASIVADGSSSTAVRVEVRDAFGNLVGASAGPVTLTTTLGTIDPVPATDHGNGTYTATLSSDATLGLAVVSGTVNGSAVTDTAGVTFRPGPVDATTTTITADSASIVADGASSTIVRVEARDAAGNPVGASAGPVALATTLGTASPVPATDHGDGTYTATLTAGTTTGLAVVSGMLAGAAIQDTATVTFRPGTVDLTTTTTITADSASIVADGVTSTTVQVELRDAAGNLMGASMGPVALSATLGTIDPVPATDHGDGTYTATLTSEATLGLAVVSGTVNGSAITDTAGVTFRSGPVDATTTTITADSVSIVADGASSTIVRVEARDAAGNLVGASAGPVTLATTLGTIDPVPATDHGDGTYTATLTAGTTTGLAVVNGTLSGAAITDTAGVRMRPGPVELTTTTTITADSASIVADGASTTSVRVELRDAGGNLVGASAGPVTLTTTLGTVDPVPATDHGDGTYTATLTAGTTLGLAVVSGTVNGSAITDTAGVRMRPGPVELTTTTTITADSASLVADGSSSTAVRVEVRDAFGNLVGASAGPVTLSSTLGTVDPVPATDHGNGTYTATLTAGTTTGLAVVNGTLSGAAITDTAGVRMRPGPVELTTTTTITADSASLVADGSSSTAVRVEVRDAFGNLVGASAGPVTLSSTLGTVDPVPATDHGDGTYTATLTAGTTLGLAVVSGTVNGSAITDTAGVTFRPGPVDATTTTITADSASIVADGVSSTAVLVEVRDAFGNLVGASAGPVTLSSTLGTVDPVPATDHGNGTYTATLTSEATLGLAVVSGTVNGSAITDTAGVTFRPGPVDATTTTITADSVSIVADGSSSTAVRVEVRDAFGNLVGASAGPVTLSSTLGTVDPVPATDHGDGTYTATLTAGTTLGLAVVSGTLAGAAIADTAGVELRPRRGDPTTTTITADSAWLFLAKPPTGEPEDDTGDTTVEEPASTIVTVRVFDALGDPLTVSAGTVTLATTLGTLGPVTDHQDGTYTATLTVGTEPGTAVVTGTLAGHPIDDTATVEFESWRP